MDSPIEKNFLRHKNDDENINNNINYKQQSWDISTDIRIK